MSFNYRVPLLTQELDRELDLSQSFCSSSL